MAIYMGQNLLPLILIGALTFAMIYSSVNSASILPLISSNGPTPLEDLPQKDPIIPTGSEIIDETQRITAVPILEDRPPHFKEEEEPQPRILQRNPSDPPTPSPSSAPTSSLTKAPTSAPISTPTLSPTMTKVITQERQEYGHNQTTTIANHAIMTIHTTTRNQTASPLSASTLPTTTLSPNSFGAQFEYNGTNSFGACLFWMDDYERLIEWIAYHYQVLPMRHLVLYRDPKSLKDPMPLLERWRPFMEITYWTSLDDLTYVPSKHILKFLEGKPLAYHNKQQGLFYRNCLNHLKRHKWKWTFVGDTDEMLVLNSKSLPLAPEMMKEPGIILKTLQAAQSGGKTMELQNNTVQIIKNEKQQRRWGNHTTVCWCLTRQQFSGYESPPQQVAKNVPIVFDPYRFQTTRFRYHRRKGIIGKCIIDASRVSVNAYTRFSQHKLVRECGSPWGDGADLMQVYHYLGTWDYFERPNDVRGGGEARYKTFMKKNLDVNKTITVRLGDTPRNWLSSFLQTFGKETSLALLEGVGFPYNNQTALPMLNVTR